MSVVKMLVRTCRRDHAGLGEDSLDVVDDLANLTGHSPTYTGLPSVSSEVWPDRQRELECSQCLHIS